MIETRIFIELDSHKLFNTQAQLLIGKDPVQTLTAHVMPEDHIQAAKLINGAIYKGYTPVLMIQDDTKWKRVEFGAEGYNKVLAVNPTEAIEEIYTSIITWMQDERTK